MFEDPRAYQSGTDYERKAHRTHGLYAEYALL